MRTLSKWLSSVSRADGESALAEARDAITRLQRINLRWNRPGIAEFLKSRHKELFL